MMVRNYTISVAMATYNGEKYIKEQISSILEQLTINDELIISDDGSTDNTLSIIKEYNDNRIHLIYGPKQGVKQNFANAISNCKGKYIFLSDQDDIWLPNKLERVLQEFEETKCSCVVHDCKVFDSETNQTLYESFYKFRNSKSGIIKNLIKNSYIGCCMTFDKSLIPHILPIPNDIEMHDQWIGIISDKYGKTNFISDKLIKYRRHGNNVSQLKRHKISKMIINRITLIRRLYS